MPNIDIVVLPQFDKEIKLLAKKYPSIDIDFEALLLALIANPTTGQSLGNSCFKIRMKITSKRSGKSGGARVITCVKIIDHRIFLISIYDKSEKESITKKEIEVILKNNGLL
jgi:hypothetical protein